MKTHSMLSWAILLSAGAFLFACGHSNKDDSSHQANDAGTHKSDAGTHKSDAGTHETDVEAGKKIFDTDILHEIRFYPLNTGDWDTMVARYPDKEYTRMNVKIDGVMVDSVGVRIKGNNFYPANGKKQALKIDFNKFEKGLKYDGLKKINLNNRDFSANHLAFKLCRDNNVPAPRTSFAKVYFDDELIGDYLLLEQINSTFCNQHFGNKKGNRYKALNKGAVLEYIGDDSASYVDVYVKKNNETENDYSDIMKLLEFFSNSSDEDFENHFDEYIDSQRFLKAMAIEMLVCKRDAFYIPGRNYYIYFNTDESRFEYIADDFDYSYNIHISKVFDLNFEHDENTNYPVTNNALIKRIIASSKLRTKYYDAVCEILKNGFDTESYAVAATQLESFGGSNGFDFGPDIDTIKLFVSKRITSIISNLEESGYNCNLTSQ